MLRITVPLLKAFALFVLGVFLAFPMSAMFGAIALLITYLPFIWQILWRTGLGLLMLTAIALFIEGLNNSTKHDS